MGGLLDRSDHVRALLRYGSDTLHQFPSELKQLSITIGAGENCNIRLASELVSSLHCTIKRRGDNLWVRDNRSKNGTWRDGVREKSFELSPGKSFIVGGEPNRLVALNQRMCDLYPELIEILGSQDEHSLQSETPSPSAVLVAAVNAGNLLILSEQGCRQQRLAQIIHEMSFWRQRDLCDISTVRFTAKAPYTALLGAAKRTSVVLDLGTDQRPLPLALTRALFLGRNQSRMIVLAPDLDTAVACLGAPALMNMQQIHVRPLRARSGAIPRLLDRELERQGSLLRFSHIRAENQAALVSYGWSENFPALERAARNLSAISKHGAVNRAAEELGESVSSLYYWYSRTMKLKFGLKSTNAEDEPELR